LSESNYSLKGQDIATYEGKDAEGYNKKFILNGKILGTPNKVNFLTGKVDYMEKEIENSAKVKKAYNVFLMNMVETVAKYD
jgi:hypothetical protein